MRRSQTISVQIDRPYLLVYAYLADPGNYPHWAAVDPNFYHRLESGDWYAEVRFGGVRHIRFTPPNEFGVLDHAVFVPGEPLLWTPMRAMPNESGTELIFTFFQRPGTSDEQFRSALEWINTDFMTLKSLLEHDGSS